ncbi:MAG: DUF3198 domain-containing protein [Methanomassiliicoccales archaeon]|nr:MAG: DUF3198 domain-containing protein [Methanomassiliicoccales archaeon]
MSIKRFFTTYTLQFGLILFILGIILTILGVFGVFIYDNAPEFLKNVIDSIGDWKYWCILLGPIILIAGAWYFFDNIQKRREFKELIETTSKAKFIRNLDRVEYLAWKLTFEHQRQLMDKKKDFNIK